MTMDPSKTPVSVLQEMMTKKHCIVTYELIHDGGGSHENTFAYKVECDGLSAVGTGRFKKEAKHNAAEEMLKKISSGLLQLTGTLIQSPVRTPLPMTVPVTPKLPPNVPFHNAVGELRVCNSLNFSKVMFNSFKNQNNMFGLTIINFQIPFV